MIRKLLKFRKDPRVPGMLLGALKGEDDPEVLKTIILGFGYIKDRRYVPDLLPFLRHDSFRVTAATIKALCRIDPDQQDEVAHPLLVSRDERTRSAAILALLSHQPDQGLTALRDLAASQSVALRRSAIACLNNSKVDGTVPIALEMFRRETDPDLLPDLATILRSRSNRDDLEAIYAFKGELLTREDEVSTAARIRELKIASLDEIIQAAVRELEVSGESLGTLEGRLEKTLQRVSRSKIPVLADQDRDRPRRRPASGAARVARALAGTLLAVAILGAASTLDWSGTVEAPVVAAAVRPPAPRGAEECVLGRLGQAVDIEGRVLQVYPSHRSFTMLAPGRVVVNATFPAGLPGGARRNHQVRIKGSISGIRSAVSLYLEGREFELLAIP